MNSQVDFITAAHDAAIEWARKILDTDPSNVFILDTETTGLDFKAEVIQIAMIDLSGDVIIDMLVRPVMPIPADATAIHGITNYQVGNAMTWSQVYPIWEELVKGKTLVIYNSDYDMRIIRQSCQARGLNAEKVWQDVHCAMLEYSEFCGEWNDYRGGFRWQKLQGGDHSALGDCHATLDLIKRMAAAKMTSEVDHA